MASVVLVADEVADIAAAMSTAVAGVTSPRHSGAMRSAISSSEPFRKNTRPPRTRAGTRSSARTSTGHTSALSSPNAPAPTAAVTAIRVGLSPLADWILKSGRIPASTAIVAVAAAHTASTRPTVRPTDRHRRKFMPPAWPIFRRAVGRGASRMVSGGCGGRGGTPGSGPGA
jgi:hypothetical protein